MADKIAEQLNPSPTFVLDNRPLQGVTTSNASETRVNPPQMGPAPQPAVVKGTPSEPRESSFENDPAHDVLNMGRAPKPA